MLENSYKNAPKAWKVISNITNRQKKYSCFPLRLDVNQKSYTKSIDIVNKQLNFHFSNIGTSTKKDNLIGFNENLRNVSNSFFFLV